MLSSRLTQKYQATIPKDVRKALNLQAGDVIEFKMKNGKVMIQKKMPFDHEMTKALENTLTEWYSKEDDAAYRDL